MDELKQLEKIQELERQIAGLPIGYISKKTINGKVRYYHQWTENRKKHSQYLRDGEMEVLQEQIDRRKSLQAQLKELQSGMPKARQPKLDFETSVIAGRGLEAMSQGVKDWGLRDCFEQLEEYLYSKESDRVCLIFGLRRTGKTTMLRQAIGRMAKEDLSRTAYIKARRTDNMAMMNRDLKKLFDAGFRYVFIDEVTLMEDFIDSAALFSDVFATMGMKIVLSGTDSLGFWLAMDEELYDRAKAIHTTFIPYREYMQRKACHDFAAKMGWVIVGEEQETGVSGYKVSADDRDKLQLIKKYAEQGKFDILLVFMFDRLGRKSDETPFVVEWFTKKGVRVWSVQEGEQRFESHTDRLTNYIRFWQADGESQKTSMRTKTALGQMVEEGRFRGGSAPYGYRLEKSGILNKRKHEVYMLVIDEDEARVVRMMFDLCISSGYGRWRLANFLNDHGIKNRKGQNWHDASVGGILHNPLYKGILRSGETYAGPFEALQIIAPDQFDLAQKLMLERTNERKERRTVPLNTTGQSLLSGNIFCGHCGGRLVLTTNGTTTRLADGTPVHKKRIRYVCYNKTRRRQECTGQTGYTMHILDGIVTEVLHQVFDKMQGASNDMIVGSAVQKQMAMIRSELQRARAENTKANKEYESLKAEVLKAIQGKSALPQDVLTEMLEDTRQKVLSTSERITTLTAELNDGNSKIEEMKAEFNRIVSWSKIFDESPMEVKKMICGYIIKKVSVFRDYRIKIEFNINVEQFLNGIDSIDECDTYELPMAQ